MNVSILGNPLAASAGALRRVLEAAGHACAAFADAHAFAAHTDAGQCELLIVDGMVADWEEFLGLVRAAGGDKLPLLLLADADDVDGIAAALSAGVDDYALRPVRQRELATRVGVLLQRAWPDRREAATLRFGRIAFDTMEGRALLDGLPVDLRQKEWALALLLFRHIGRPLSRATLMETVWAQDADTPSRTVDTHVSRVRAKLGLNGASGYRLAQVYGFGYVLEAC